MKLKLFIFFLTTFFLLSCNNQVKNEFAITIDAVIGKTDSINVYYSKNKSITFNDKQSFWIKVAGGKKNQKIKILFPDSLQPLQIRLDFGRNVAQPPIVINKIEFSYQKKCFSLKGKEIFYILRVDDSNSTLDPLNGSINRKKSNQINGPSLYPAGDKLYNKLTELYSKN